MAKKNNKAHTQPGRASRDFGAVTGLIDSIWNEITSYQGHDWGLPENPKTLENLIGPDETNKLYSMKDTIEQNVYLHTLLVNPLKDKDRGKRVKAIKWIVVEWGRINKGSADLENWVDLLKDYDDKTIEDFVKSFKKERVASWSKVLAFADSTKYAILDSRVALSLNIILENVNYPHRFIMPPSRVEDVNELFKLVKNNLDKKPKHKYLDYLDYLELLRAIEKNTSKNILDIEMRLFANTDRLASEYAKKHNIAYKEDKKS